MVRVAVGGIVGFMLDGDVACVVGWLVGFAVWFVKGAGGLVGEPVASWVGWVVRLTAASTSVPSLSMGAGSFVSRTDVVGDDVGVAVMVGRLVGSVSLAGSRPRITSMMDCVRLDASCSFPAVGRQRESSNKRRRTKNIVLLNEGRVCECPRVHAVPTGTW